MKSQPEFDSRKYQRSLERQLVAGGILVGGFAGIGLIYLFWGSAAALTSVGCLAGLVVVIGVVWGFLAIIARLGEPE